MAAPVCELPLAGRLVCLRLVPCPLALRPSRSPSASCVCGAAQVFLGTPLKLWASVGHWLVWHFDLNKYTPKQRTRVGEYGEGGRGGRMQGGGTRVRVVVSGWGAGGHYWRGGYSGGRDV